MIVSADFTTDMMAMSGIADFDNITLDKMLSDKVFSVSPYISELREGFSGSSSVKDVETCFKWFTSILPNHVLTKPVFNRYMTRYVGSSGK